VATIPRRSGHQVASKPELCFFLRFRGALRDVAARRFSRAGAVVTGMG
jgi:hypothetical protein